MAETPDKLFLVQNIAVHFHGSHSFQLSQMSNELITSDFDLFGNSIVSEDVSDIMIIDLLL